MKANKKFLRSLSDERLRPLITYCWQNRGAKADIQRRLNKILPEPVPKIQISNWLNSDAKKRAIPSYPTALLLLQVWEELKSEIKKAA